MDGWQLPLAPERAFSLALAQERVGVMQFTSPSESLGMSFNAVVIGTKGDKGDSGGTYTHTQEGAAAMWTVNHNLGYRPAIRALSAGGMEVWGEALHANVNQTILYFDAPFMGSAICS